MTPPKLKGLGRGLDALLAGNTGESGNSGELRTLDVGLLQPGKYQPRTRMDPGSLEELMGRTGFAAGPLASALTLLEARGLVTSYGGVTFHPTLTARRIGRTR